LENDGDLMDQNFAFDNLIRILRDFWKNYFPGGEYLDKTDIDDIEDAETLP
jgi:hypothetical protein